MKYFESITTWNSNTGIMGVDKCISKTTVNNKNETINRDATCQTKDSEGKSFYVLIKSIRGGDGSFLDEFKFVSGEGRWKLLLGQTCFSAYSLLLGDSLEGYLTYKGVCKIPDNIFKEFVNYSEDKN